MSKLLLKEIPLDTASPDLAQPRKLIYSIDEILEKVQQGDQRAKMLWESLSSLANSILEVGLQQPITVYPNGDGYTIYDGHRRWLAMSLLHRQGQGNGTIPAYIRTQPELEQEALLGQLSVNTQREGFNVFELARSLQQVFMHLRTNGGSLRLVREDGGIDTVNVSADTSDSELWNAIERMVGISRSRRYQIESVLKNLSPRIQEIAEEAGIPESTLRYLIPVKDEQLQEKIIQEILTKNLSNAEIRARIKELQEQVNTPPPPAMPKPIQIESALKPIQELVKEINRVKNVTGAISEKDPRTVARYRETIPVLRTTVDDIKRLLDKLEFLETA